MLASAGQIVVTFAFFAVAQCAPRKFPLSSIPFASKADHCA